MSEAGNNTDYGTLVDPIPPYSSFELRLLALKMLQPSMYWEFVRESRHLQGTLLGEREEKLIKDANALGEDGFFPPSEFFTNLAFDLSRVTPEEGKERFGTFKAFLIKQSQTMPETATVSQVND
jgi:hypothetical protein